MPGMKKLILYTMPLLFAVVLFGFYILLYPSPIGSSDFSTALMAFSTGLGGCALIIFAGPRIRTSTIVFYTYLSLSVLIPPAMFLFSNLFNTVEHIVIYGLMLAVFGLGKIFIDAQLRPREKKQ